MAINKSPPDFRVSLLHGGPGIESKGSRSDCKNEEKTEVKTFHSMPALQFHNITFWITHIDQGELSGSGNV